MIIVRLQKLFNLYPCAWHLPKRWIPLFQQYHISTGICERCKQKYFEKRIKR